MVKYIDADKMILGRMSSIVAKMLLNGEEVVILNAERTAIVGNKYTIYRRYEDRRHLGDGNSKRKGPFYPRMPDRIVKRTVKGMLPKENTRGREALKRLKVYIGTPPEFKNVKLTEIDAKVDGIEGTTYITVGDLSHQMGAKF